MAPSAHAVELFRERLAARGVIPVAEAGRRRDRSMVRLAGLAVSVQHLMTAKNFVFIALEDETGMINVTCRPEIYQANRAVLHRHPLLVIDGTLQVEGEVLNVVARRLHPVDAVVNEEARQTAAAGQAAAHVPLISRPVRRRPPQPTTDRRCRRSACRPRRTMADRRTAPS